MLAGGMRSSGAFWKRTVSVSASSRMACAARVSKFSAGGAGPAAKAGAKQKGGGKPTHQGCARAPRADVRCGHSRSNSLGLDSREIAGTASANQPPRGEAGAAFHQFAVRRAPWRPAAAAAAMTAAEPIFSILDEDAHRVERPPLDRPVGDLDAAVSGGKRRRPAPALAASAKAPSCTMRAPAAGRAATAGAAAAARLPALASRAAAASASLISPSGA